jgi:fructose-1,6-bisphosphatase/inositol monophosphatase family enzyme
MDHEKIKDLLLEIGSAVCRKVHHSLKEQSIERLSAVAQEGADDTIYQIDREVEEEIVPLLAEHAEDLGGVVLVAEGIGEEEELVLPEGWQAEDCQIKIIMDPIDGTRGIMYDKRSAFFLAAAAPNKGATNTLRDLEVSVMVELPTSRGEWSDHLWAIKGQGAHRYSRHLGMGTVKKCLVSPSQSPTILGGFAQIARFFPPGRQILAAIEEEMLEQLFPDAPEGKTILFEDQYISSGGQMYELIVGHDRFIADIRTALFQRLKREGKKIGHVCHPYDLAALLIAEEAGVIVTDLLGNPLSAPLDTQSPVDWVGYANSAIRAQVAGTFISVIRKHGLIH